MKARISMPAEKPLVLAYGLSAERMAALAGLLEKLGFQKCGIVHVPEDSDPRYAYEKLEG